MKKNSLLSFLVGALPAFENMFEGGKVPVGDKSSPRSMISKDERRKRTKAKKQAKKQRRK